MRPEASPVLNPVKEPLFPSFFWGGIECSSHVNTAGRRLDQMAATQHDRLCRADYARMAAVGIRTVREAARWHWCDRFGGHEYDFSVVARMAEAAQREGMCLVWDLCHYGYPDDVDPFSPAFVTRFADFCAAFARQVLPTLDSPRQLWVTPINEPSYFAWAAGDAGRFAPMAEGRAGDLKAQLVRATVAGLDAIWRVAPGAGVLSCDPLVRAVAPLAAPELADAAQRWSEQAVTESFDWLAGLRYPELGGARRYLGVVGLNIYALCQWEYERPRSFLSPSDPRWWPIRRLLQFASDRWGGPLVIAETGETRDHRAPWLHALLGEVDAARAAGVDVQGVCLYPALGPPDWEDTTAFYESGLWDLLPQPDGMLARVLYEPLAAEMTAWLTRAARQKETVR